MEIRVDPRVHTRHPEISDGDAISAWKNAIEFAQRYEESGAIIKVALGFDTSGRLLEMVAVSMDEGYELIYHAAKAKKKTLSELGMIGR